MYTVIVLCFILNAQAQSTFSRGELESAVPGLVWERVVRSRYLRKHFRLGCECYDNMSSLFRGYSSVASTSPHGT